MDSNLTAPTIFRCSGLLFPNKEREASGFDMTALRLFVHFRRTRKYKFPIAARTLGQLKFNLLMMRVQEQQERIVGDHFAFR